MLDFTKNTLENIKNDIRDSNKHPTGQLETYKRYLNNLLKETSDRDQQSTYSLYLEVVENELRARR